MWPGGAPRKCWVSPPFLSWRLFWKYTATYQDTSSQGFFLFFFADLHGEQKQNLKHVGHSGRFLPHRLKATQWHVNKHAQVFFTAHSSCSLIIQCGRLFNPKLVLALFFISPLSSKVKQEAALFAVKKQTNYHLSSCWRRAWSCSPILLHTCAHR